MPSAKGLNSLEWQEGFRAGLQEGHNKHAEAQLRLEALKYAVQSFNGALNEMNGQTTIRRAVGFYEFLSGNINKKKADDGLTSP